MRTDLKAAFRGWIDPLAALLVAARVGADAISGFGLALSCGSAALFAVGRPREAALVLFAAGLCDVLDGAVARRSGGATRFGAFLDSTLDRYADGVVFAGIAWHAARVTGDAATLGFALAALIGAFAVSYARARAEGLGQDCAVGLMERPERVLLLAGGALVGGHYAFPWVLAVLAIGAHATAIQRIVHVHGRIGRRRGARADVMDAEGGLHEH